MARRCDAKLLRSLVTKYQRKHGKTVAETAEYLDVSKSLLEQLMGNRYEPEVKEDTQLRLSKKLNVSRQRLFRVVAATEEKSIS